MMTGKIAHMVIEKGFGFIQVEGMEKNLFFHTKDFSGDFNSLQKGDAVSFESIKDSEKGKSAKGVTFA